MHMLFSSLLCASSVSAILSGSASSTDVVVLDASLTASFSFWFGGSVTLSQCNSQCAEVNTGLFSTCGAYQSVFQRQMQCCCSTTFIEKVKICSACCNKLGYTSYYSQLTQVDSACDVLDKKGNTTDVAKTLSYTPVTYTATLPAKTATQTIVILTTAEALPTTLPAETRTIYIVTTADSGDEETTTTVSSTKHASASVTSTSSSSTSTVSTTTATSVSMSSKAVVTTTASTTKVALPTVTAESSAERISHGQAWQLFASYLVISLLATMPYIWIA